MSFEKDYNKLLTYARNRVNYRKLDVEPEELINEAYIKQVESGKPYDFSEIKRLIGNEGIISQHKSNVTIRWGIGESGSISFRAENTCRVCKDVKPASAFRIVTEKNGNKYQWNRCIECDNKYSSLWKKTEAGKLYVKNQYKKRVKKHGGRLNNPEKNKKAFKKFVDNNRSKWNEYLRNRDGVGREQLTDVYIRKVLRSKHSTEYLLSHPELIIETRARIEQKRLGKLKKAS